MLPLYGAVPLSYVQVRVSICPAEPRSSAGPFFPSQCPCGTILPTLYSIMWGLLVSRAGANAFFVGPAARSVLIYYFSFSLPFVSKLVLWGWGL